MSPTDPRSLRSSTPVLIPLGPRPEEPGQFVIEGAPQTYPPEVRARLEVDARKIIDCYPHPRSALLPLLHLVQAEDSYLTPAGLEFCAEQLGLTGAEVAAVATFYTMYRRGPTGDYFVGVCTNTLCAVMGGDAIFGALKDHLGIDNDQTTPDGKITLQHVECNAACDYAPVVMVNWEFFDNQTPESVRRLVDSLRGGEQVAPSRGLPLCTFRQTERILAGFPDNRADDGQGGVGAATLAGLRVAQEHGMWPPSSKEQATQPKPDVGESPAETAADEPAPAPSEPVPPKAARAEDN